ncbi:hypothetical protein B0J17DRAFT_633598 [Rhizoctonia solani]|nr:hypothetical protein B0J17DRAFT_633598 [Rhizoctonia solani]
MFDLPNELVRIIIGYGTDIRQFILLNKHYNAIATPVLYKSVVFQDLPPLQAFNQTLTERLILRAHVTTLRFTFSSTKATYDSLVLREEIRHLLMLVPALTDLTLSLDQYISEFLFEQPQYPFLLHRFCVEPLESDDFVRFLETQHQIETLHFKTYVGQKHHMPGIIPMLGRHVLPNLKEVEAIPTTIMNLVPNRPVSRVMVDRSWDHSFGMYDAIRRSSAPLAQFREYITPQQGTWDTEIVRLLERLEHSKESLKDLMIWIVSNNHSNILPMGSVLLLEAGRD